MPVPTTRGRPSWSLTVPDEPGARYSGFPREGVFEYLYVLPFP